MWRSDVTGTSCQMSNVQKLANCQKSRIKNFDKFVTTSLIDAIRMCGSTLD